MCEGDVIVGAFISFFICMILFGFIGMVSIDLNYKNYRECERLCDDQGCEIPQGLGRSEYLDFCKEVEERVKYKELNECFGGENYGSFKQD